MTTKYYIGEIEAQCGEYSFTCKLRFKTGIDPSIYLDQLTKEFYGVEPDDNDDEDCYYFNDGELACQPGCFQEVSREVYNAITLLNEIEAENI